MAAPLQILALQALLGPNIFSPQPGVVLRLRCAANYTDQVRGAMKDAVQFVGMVLAYLEVQAELEPAGQWHLAVQFTTPQPLLGRDLAAYVVAGLNATLTNDEEWDRDTPLLALQQRRRREQLPPLLLQWMADARQRQIPTTLLPDGPVLFGYGRQSWQIAPRAFARSEDDEDHPAPAPPDWRMLGVVPFYVVTGAQRVVVAQQIAQHLQARGVPVALHPDADLAGISAALADPGAAALVVGLATDLILAHGVPFTTCQVAVVTALDAADYRNEARQRAAYLPLLLAHDAAFVAHMPQEMIHLVRCRVAELEQLPSYLDG